MNSTLATGLRMLAAAAFSTGLVLFAHVSVQQAHRQGANDPQIQMAEDAAAAIEAGAAPRTLVPVGRVDLAASLAPWLVVVNRDNQVIAGSAVLDGRTPVPPAGVLAFAREHREDRISWEPRHGVRSAIVARAARGAGGFVVIAGRSLREVEAREQRLTFMTILTWIGALATSLVWAGLGPPQNGRNP